MIQLSELAAVDPAAALAFSAIKTNTFIHPSGQSESLNEVVNPIEQVALIAWLARNCQTRLSLEIGFGMGMTATIILAARSQTGRPFDHRIFDPFGLPENRGELVQNFLSRHFRRAFQRIKKPSQFGMAELADKHYRKCGFILVDGDHRTDAVFADFYAADHLLSIGGFMVLDDAWFAPVETVVQYVIHNRPDYEVSFLELPNTAIFKKVSSDDRNWDYFRPFPVPQRSDWSR